MGEEILTASPVPFDISVSFNNSHQRVPKNIAVSCRSVAASSLATRIGHAVQRRLRCALRVLDDVDVDPPNVGVGVVRVCNNARVEIPVQVLSSGVTNGPGLLRHSSSYG